MPTVAGEGDEDLVDLTAIAQSVYEQGLIAGRMLVDAVEQGTISEPRLHLDTRLMLRGTTCAVRRPSS